MHKLNLFRGALLPSERFLLENFLLLIGLSTVQLDMKISPIGFLLKRNLK